MGAHIDTICLPQPEELFDFQTCFARGSSLTTLSSALAELMARTLAREMEAALWSARASSTQRLTSRLASLLGVSVVVRTTHLVSTPLCPRVSAGSTTP